MKKKSSDRVGLLEQDVERLSEMLSKFEFDASNAVIDLRERIRDLDSRLHDLQRRSSR